MGAWPWMRRWRLWRSQWRLARNGRRAGLEAERPQGIAIVQHLLHGRVGYAIGHTGLLGAQGGAAPRGWQEDKEDTGAHRHKTAEDPGVTLFDSVQPSGQDDERREPLPIVRHRPLGMDGGTFLCSVVDCTGLFFVF
jgi:hypothetical protein